MNIIKHEKREEIRLNKYISDSGYSSRREADRLIEKGLVTIDDKVALVGTKVLPGQVVKVEGNIISLVEAKTYIALNKPRGITTTNDLEIKGNIREFVNYHKLIFSVGRLDKDSSGLILLTDDGDIVNKILRKEYGHDKEYVVTVNKDITKAFINNLKNGVKIYNPVAKKYQVTNKCEVIKVNNKTFRIILKQGLNRQIRRMVRTQGYTVDTLTRVRVMNIKLGSLKEGKWRYLTKEELKELNQLINK